MTPLKSSLLAALGAALLTAGILAAVHHHRTKEASALRLANHRLRGQAELLRLATAQAKTPAAAVADAAAPAPAAVPASPPAGDYRNEGQASPLATLQTLAWACDRGDPEAVARLFLFDPAARAKFEAYAATLPEAARAQWESTDAMAAALLTSAFMHRPFPSATILATATSEPLGENRVRLRLPDSPKDRTEYQQTDTGWKYVITEAMVDAYIAHTRSTR